jgi:hypothetical protein
VLLSLMSEIFEVRRGDGLRYHEVYAHFHDNRFRNSSNIKLITSTDRAVMLVSLIGETYDVSHGDGLGCHDVQTKI